MVITIIADLPSFPEYFMANSHIDRCESVYEVTHFKVTKYTDDVIEKIATQLATYKDESKYNGLKYETFVITVLIDGQQLSAKSPATFIIDNAFKLGNEIANTSRRVRKNKQIQERWLNN